MTHLRDVGFSPVRIVAMVINEDEKPIIKSVDQIAVKANGSPDAAETAVGTILCVIQKEGNATKVGQLFQQLPGAADLGEGTS